MKISNDGVASLLLPAGRPPSGYLWQAASLRSAVIGPDQFLLRALSLKKFISAISPISYEKRSRRARVGRRGIRWEDGPFVSGEKRKVFLKEQKLPLFFKSLYSCF